MSALGLWRTGSQAVPYFPFLLFLFCYAYRCPFDDFLLSPRSYIWAEMFDLFPYMYGYSLLLTIFVCRGVLRWRVRSPL